MLYIVGTPIGNLSDFSPRQAETILDADIILAEDTRSSATLLRKAQELYQTAPKAGQRTISYYKEKEFEKLPEVLEFLRDEKNVVLISESGMPLISDPGYLLLKSVIREKIPYTVIPGPTAATTAVVAAGMKSDSFMFLGFLPKKESQQVMLTNKMKAIAKIDTETLFVFYESPKRINETMTLFDKYIPDADVVICRELTKMYEEVIRGKPKDLIDGKYKGEITLVVKIV